MSLIDIDYGNIRAIDIVLIGLITVNIVSIIVNAVMVKKGRG